MPYRPDVEAKHRVQDGLNPGADVPQNLNLAHDTRDT